jgi:hypothetical protein
MIAVSSTATLAFPDEGVSMLQAVAAPAKTRI